MRMLLAQVRRGDSTIEVTADVGWVHPWEEPVKPTGRWRYYPIERMMWIEVEGHAMRYDGTVFLDGAWVAENKVTFQECYESGGAHNATD